MRGRGSAGGGGLRLAALWLIVGLLTSCTEPPPDQGAREAELRAAVARYDSLWMAKDVPAVGRMLADDYLYFASTGRLLDRPAILGFVGDTSYVLTRSERTEVDVTLVGSVGRVSSRWRGEGRYRGEVVDDDQTCGLTWLRDGGSWRLLTEHCVNRPDGG